MVAGFFDILRAALISGCAVLALTPLAVRLLRRLRLLQPVRHADCPALEDLQTGKRETPIMGGVVVLAAAAAAAALAGGLRGPSGVAVFATILALGGLGAADDLLKLRGVNAVGIRSMPKLLYSIVWALALGAFVLWKRPDLMAVKLPGLGYVAMSPAIWMGFAVLVLSGTVHAVNLTDGMDGLASGSLAITFSALCFWIVRENTGLGELAIWCAALFGACVAFLWFNSHPASIFLGDVGALGLGAALGTLALLSGGGVWLLIAGAVYVAETLSVVLQVGSFKLRHGKRVFRVAPLHHHFHMGGVPEPNIVVRFWLVSLAAAGLALVLV